MNNYVPLISASELCVPCGLCCDGSLFGHAHLQEGEQEKARSFGMFVNAFGDHEGFHLPCPQFNSCCIVYYQQRPYICGAFQCKLLNNYLNRKVDLETALGFVHTARALLDDLVRLSPSSDPSPMTLQRIRREVSDISAYEESDERDSHVDFLLTTAKYEMFILSKFRPQRRAAEKKAGIPGMDAL